MAAAQGKSLKAFIQQLLIEKADTLKIEVANPCPSGDEYFEHPGNLIDSEARITAYKKGESETKVVLESADDITKFINGL